MNGTNLLEDPEGELAKVVNITKKAELPTHVTRSPFSAGDGRMVKTKSLDSLARL